MKEAKKVKTKDRSIILRPSRITDLWRVHRMYDSLSQESKHFFSPGIFGFRSISWYWLLAQGALLLSSVAFTRRLLRRVYPKASIFMVVALEADNPVHPLIGFAYIRGDTSSRDFSLSICVHDSHQGQAIGSKLTEELIRWAGKEGAKKITLSVHRDNIKAISLYEKYGFKVDSFTMALELRESKRGLETSLSNKLANTNECLRSEKV